MSVLIMGNGNIGPLIPLMVLSTGFCSLNFQFWEYCMILPLAMRLLLFFICLIIWISYCNSLGDYHINFLCTWERERERERSWKSTGSQFSYRWVWTITKPVILWLNLHWGKWQFISTIKTLNSLHPFNWDTGLIELSILITTEVVQTSMQNI